VRIYRLLRFKVAASDRLIREIVNDAVHQSLAEDAENLNDADTLKSEETISFETFVFDLRNIVRM